jgi:MFS transporter, FSR family, fosmidomycin resistance protein
MTDRRQLATLACGHACAYFCQGAVPALVPFLVHRGGMDFKATGVLVLVMSVASSLLQPLIGARADRSRMAWAVPAGVALGGLGIAAIGVVDGFVPRVIAVAVAGLGVALFHPGGARRATRAAAERPGSGLGMFAVGGSAGFALAPALLTPSILAFGLNGTLVALVPALAVAALLTTTQDAPPKTSRQTGDTRLPGRFWLLMFVSSLRAGAYFGLQAFLAAALIDRLGVGTATGNAALTVLLVAGAFGTYLGGRLADRYGYELVLAVALGLTLPAVALIELSPSPALAFPAAALAGIAVVAGYTSTVVLGQRMLPRRETFAAGMTLGVAMGAGGLTVALLGPLADSAGPDAALWISGALAALAVPAALKIGGYRLFARRPSATAAG